MERQFLRYNLQQTWKKQNIISLKSNLENPYSVFPQTPTLLYDSAWSDIRQMPRLGKAVLKNLLLGIIAAEFRIARDRMKQAVAPKKGPKTKSEFVMSGIRKTNFRVP